MDVFSRRAVAVLAAAALVSAPAIALVGDGGAAHAGGTGRTAAGAVLASGTAGTSCRTAAPAGLLGGLGDTLGGLLGGGSGGSDSTDPVTGLLGTLTTAIGSTGATDPGTALAGVLTGGGDPTQVVDTLTGLLSGAGAQDLIDQLGALDPTDAATLVTTLTGALPISDVFPDGLPPEVSSLLPGPAPTTVTDLVDQLAAAYHAQGATEPSAQVQKALPQSVLDALRAALAKMASATPSPTTHPTTGGCVTPPVSKCRAAAAKVQSLKKRLRAARHHHHAAKTKALAKRLQRAKRAKRHAC